MVTINASRIVALVKSMSDEDAKALFEDEMNCYLAALGFPPESIACLQYI